MLDRCTVRLFKPLVERDRNLGSLQPIRETIMARTYMWIMYVRQIEIFIKYNVVAGAPLPPFIFKLSRDRDGGVQRALDALDAGNTARSLVNLAIK